MKCFTSKHRMVAKYVSKRSKVGTLRKNFWRNFPTLGSITSNGLSVLSLTYVPKGSFRQGAFSACSCSRQLHCRKLEKFISQQKRNYLAQPHAENTASCRKHSLMQKTQPHSENTASCRKHSLMQKTQVVGMSLRWIQRNER